jgi:hypothetical protein
MAEMPEFQRRQFAFAAHIREPGANPAPAAIEDRRMAIYRDLFLNNLVSLLGSTFPVLKKLHTRDDWRRLVRTFMARHRAHTPYFLEIPREFLNFLEKEYKAHEGDLPVLPELAHYEWVELALSVAPDADPDENGSVDADGDLLDGVPVRSSLAWSFSYRYPVHRISPEYIPVAPGEQRTHLVVYRQADDEDGFMELRPNTARLLEMIGDQEDATGRALLKRLAAEIDWPDADSLIAHGAEALAGMREAGILLGTRKI